MIRRADLFQPGAVGPLQGAKDDSLAKPAPCLSYAVDHPFGRGGQVGLFIHIVTAAAVAAGRGGVLAEIFQNIVAQAGRCLAVTLHRLQPLQVALAQKLGVLVVGFRKILAVQQKLVDDHILRRKEQNALGRKPIAPGAACLLVIILHALGHIVVQHEPHVGFVDAHAEGVRRHDDGGFVVDEIVLVLLARLGGQTRVVLGGGKAVVSQQGLQLVYIFAGGTVDDAALARVVAQVLQHKIILAVDLLHLKVEIRPVKTGDKQLRVMQPQRADDIVPHLPRGSGRKGGQDGAFREAVHKIKDF